MQSGKSSKTSRSAGKGGASISLSFGFEAQAQDAGFTQEPVDASVDNREAGTEMSRWPRLRRLPKKG